MDFATILEFVTVMFEEVPVLDLIDMLLKLVGPLIGGGLLQ
jgi:hypothetical protein